MTGGSIRVSVIVPCYNAGPYLAQALGSALDQHRPPDEVLVIDDGSTDDSVAIAKRFEALAPATVRVYRERSRRAGQARNLGATLASGDGLLFLDADDVLDPGTIAALSTALDAQPGSVAICPWFRLAQDGGAWVALPPSCEPRAAGQDPLAAWLTGWYHPPCSVMWSRAAFEAAGRWDELLTSNQDGDLMMRALVSGVRVAEAGGGAGYYRRRADGQLSLSARRFGHGSLRDRIRVIRKIACGLTETGRVDDYRAELAAAFHLLASESGRAGFADLTCHARALAAHYRPPLGRRLARRLAAPQRARSSSGVRQERTPGIEIRHGLDRAAAALHTARPADTDVEPARPRRPAVSVIVPTFNRAALLPRAIASVLAQTFSDVELLVVDDGSTDDTADVVARFADPRVRCIVQPRNAGVAAARNRGLREVRADLVAFLDSDDEWLPEKLARQVAVFRDAPDDLGLVYTGVECVWPDGRRRVDRPLARGDVYRPLLAHNVVHGGGSNVMMRRSVVATVGFFNETLPAIEDYDYWLRVARFFTVDYVDAPLIRYYDPSLPWRRSQALQANLETREWFFRKHAREMRRARVAHLFLLKSMRRALGAMEPDVRAARRLALRAVQESPASRDAIAGLLQAFRSRASGPAERAR